MVGGVFGGLGGAASGAITSSFASASVTPAATGVIGAGVGAGGFAAGGYTGHGHPTEIAGVVHRGEYVIPAGPTAEHLETLAAIRAGAHPDRIADLIAGPRRLAMSASLARASSPKAAGSVVSSSAVHAAVSAAAGHMADMADRIEGQKLVPLIINEQTADQIAGSPELQRKMAAAQAGKYRQTWVPVHRSLRGN